MTLRTSLPAILALAVLAGCAADPARPPAGEGKPPPAEAASLPPDSAQLQASADARAAAWSPEARLILVAAFEGAVPDWSGGRSNPWVAPYYDRNGTVGDGRSSLWSYSYAVADEVGGVALALCGQGVHAELREAFVVTLDEAGKVVAEFTTRNDDEGSVPVTPLPHVALSSADAAAALQRHGEARTWVATASFGRTFLATDWFQPGPAWAFQLELPDGESRNVAVHAETGEVTVGFQPPPC